QVVLLSLAYLANGFGVYGTVFFVPLIIKDLGFSNLTTSWLAALASAVGAMALGAAGLLLTGLTIGDAPLEIIGLCVAGFGIGGNLPIFWNLPTAYLSAATAAAGIAVINAVGNLSGYFAPQLV